MEDDKKNISAENENAEDMIANKDSGTDDELSLLKDELEKAMTEARENLFGWQRAKADFINYKKDQEKVLGDFRKYANMDIIMSLLPTVDSFDLAAKHLPDELKGSEWVKGIMCIRGMFENFLQGAGVTEIKALGEKFDPHLFEAVGEEESDEEEDTVIEEIQKGYRMGERIIRPAKVKIAKKKE